MALGLCIEDNASADGADETNTLLDLNIALDGIELEGRAQHDRDALSLMVASYLDVEEGGLPDDAHQFGADDILTHVADMRAEHEGHGLDELLKVGMAIATYLLEGVDANASTPSRAGD